MPGRVTYIQRVFGSVGLAVVLAVVLREGSAGTPFGSMAMPYSAQIDLAVELPSSKTEANQPETASENAEIAEESAKLGRPSAEAAQVGAEPRNDNIARTRVKGASRRKAKLTLRRRASGRAKSR